MKPPALGRFEETSSLEVGNRNLTHVISGLWCQDCRKKSKTMATRPKSLWTIIQLHIRERNMTIQRNPLNCPSN